MCSEIDRINYNDWDNGLLNDSDCQFLHHQLFWKHGFLSTKEAFRFIPKLDYSLLGKPSRTMSLANLLSNRKWKIGQSHSKAFKELFELMDFFASGEQAASVG